MPPGPKQVTAPPSAEGQRVHWTAVPQRVRAAIERELGSPVVSAVTQRGGFSPGLAARLTLQDGRRRFVKATGPELNPDSPDIHRREIRISSALPATAPVSRLIGSCDEGPGGWVALIFEDIEGRQPRLPWISAELDRVLTGLSQLAYTLTPSPLSAGVARDASQLFAERICGWQILAAAPPPHGLDHWAVANLDRLARIEAHAPEAVAGDSLNHFDVRADNVLLTPDHVYFVDWPHAATGAPWVDLVGFAPSVAMQGGPGPEALVARHPAAKAANADALTAAIVAIAGYFVRQSLQPAPPGLPTVRA